MFRKTLVIGFLFLLKTCLFSQAVADLSDTIHVHSLSGQTQVIEDPARTMVLQDVLKPDVWKNTSNRYSYDFTSSAFWTRTVINVPKAGEYKFYFDNNGLNEVYFYIFKGDTLVSEQRGGNCIAYTNRADITNKISCLIRADRSAKFTVYALVRAGKGASFFPAYAGIKRSFDQRIYYEELFTGLFYGISFIISITFLFSFLFTRDRNYFLYAIVALIHLFNRMSFSGHADVFFGDHPLIRNYTDALSQCLGMAVAVYFIIYFLNTGRHFKWQHYGLVACFAVMAFAFFAAFFSPGLGITIGNTVSPAIMIFSISAASLRFKRQHHKPALYFLIGWGCFYMGVVLLLLSNFALLPSYYVHAFEAGVLAEMIFFSMAVAENYKLLKEEQQKAQQKAYETLRENQRLIKEQNIMLEQKVQERTIELAEKNKEILDSIRYASRIQKSLLPNEKYIRRVLRELRPEGQGRVQ